MSEPTSLGGRKILIFWLPLAATWLMMAAEGPFLAAVIARLADPKYNLAAYGVAFSFALIIEAPVIMIMSAATALVHDRQSFHKLRRFTFALNGILTGLMLAVIWPPAYRLIMTDLIQLPESVSAITHWALVVMIPWPGAIGYRRFYQGVLIRSSQTRRVAYGTMTRLFAMSGTALTLFWSTGLDGAVIGASALSVGVTVEAIAIRFMARDAVRKIHGEPVPGDSERTPMTNLAIVKFYYPLALTSMISLGIHPIITFFLGQSRAPLESLAVMPVVLSLTFIFISTALSYQEVVITFLGEDPHNYRPLRHFASLLAAALSLVLFIIAFTPVSRLWLINITGLTPQLSDFTLTPIRILILLPAMSVWLSFQRSILVCAHRTAHITVATAMEAALILLTLFVLIRHGDAVGAIAAATAILAGRMFANLYLLRPRKRALAIMSANA
jgi:hypothetical protein